MVRAEQDTLELRELILDEIRLVVAEAIGSGDILWIGPHARRLLETHPGSGWSEGHIADELILAAANAGVPVEISRPGLRARTADASLQ